MRLLSQVVSGSRFILTVYKYIVFFIIQGAHTIMSQFHLYSITKDRSKQILKIESENEFR